MNIVGFILLSVSAYFVAAAFYPRIRMRWGVSYSKTLFPRTQVSTITLKPHMGMITCLGLAISIGSFALTTIWDQIMGDWMVEAFLTGFGLIAVGAVLDSMREPTKTLKKNRKK